MRTLRVLVMVAMLAVLTSSFTGSASATTPSADSATHLSSGKSPEIVADLSEDTVDAARGARIGPVARRAVRSWPGKTIRYYANVPASYRWSLNAAIGSWNATGLNKTFKLVTSKKKADATITVDKHLQVASGLATVGYTRGTNWIRLGPSSVTGTGSILAFNRIMFAHIIAHEIGHNLGLQHNTKVSCALMQPILYGTCPLLDKQNPGYYLCNIVDRAALDPMVRRYGGKKTLGASGSCTFDPLPPPITFTFSGGIEGDAPVSVHWTPPSKIPSGSAVNILYDEGCTFPVYKDGFGNPVGRSSLLARVAVSGGAWTQPSTDFYEKGCYAAQFVNASGAGRAPAVSPKLTSYVPQPSTPVAGVVRRVAWDDQSYSVPISGLSDDDTELAYLAGQTCPTTWPAGTDYTQHRVFPNDATVMVDSDLTNPCFSIFQVRKGVRFSVPAQVQVTSTEPAPAPLGAVTMRRMLGSSSLDVRLDYDSNVQLQPVAVVKPKDQCVSSWPAGWNPDDHTASGFLDDDGNAYPCVTFFPRNARGDLGPAKKVQLQPAATPVAPTVSNVHWDADSFAFKATVTIRSDLTLVVYPGPACATTWPSSEEPAWWVTYVGDGGETFVYAENTHPCLSFFAVNDDGVISSGVAKQT